MLWLTWSPFLPFFFLVLTSCFVPCAITARKLILLWMGFACFICIKAEMNTESFSSVKQNNILLFQHVFLTYWTVDLDGKCRQCLLICKRHPSFCKTDPVLYGFCLDLRIWGLFLHSTAGCFFSWDRLAAFSLTSHWARVLLICF